MSSVSQAVWGFLATDGSLPNARSALTNLKVNGSSTPVIFYYEAPAGQGVRLNRINGVLDSSDECEADYFAGGASVLTNGLKFQLRDPSDNVSQLSPLIKSNIDFCFLAGTDVGHANFTARVDREVLVFKWTLSKGFADGAPMLPPGWRFEVVVQDDLTAAGWDIDNFDFYLQGSIA